MAAPTPEQAAAELLRRKRARSSLIEYSQAVALPGVPIVEVPDEMDPLTGRLLDPVERHPVLFRPVSSRIAIHHILMMQAIERCVTTPRGRLMILAPPGSAKSTYASVVTPSWCMGRQDNTLIILASYATAIAAKQSRKVRAICKDPQYVNIWESRPMLLDDQRAVDDWSLTNGSGMMAAGLLAGITGNRADGLIIDDPVANREQADSATIREKIYNEYIDTAMTRAKPNMWVIMIMTRWHEEDLCGSILPLDYAGESGRILCRDGQVWEVLCIPAEAEREDDVLGRRPRRSEPLLDGAEVEGEFLWPEWFPRAHWSTWRDNPRAKRTWGALYQQRPAPDSGIHFDRSMFKWYDPSLARMD